ncbi:skin secretory protein xP2 isoform X1 [Oryzias melastigma]|uniref:skin secretory protein xP2 isoform X1 n=1 Tax=Oryzias melastigma TaxID=30732 RepID=UPI000CF7C2A8|nr:skin secretory protein xP2 isoform X1 [Oryzias melastigma]
MEETPQQERQELEDKIQNEEEGGIRRRLRDRDLLRKRKAEAEEKETYQWVFGVESQRKRSRTQNGTKRRGRPRKIEPQLTVVQEEAPDTQFTPAVVVAPEPAADASEQISAFLAPYLVKESTPAPALAPPVLAGPAPGLDFAQSSVFDSTLPPSAPLNPALVTSSPKDLAPTSDGAPALSLATGLGPASVPVFGPSPVPAPSLAPLFGPPPVPAPVLGPAPPVPGPAPAPGPASVFAPAPALLQESPPAPASVSARAPASPPASALLQDSAPAPASVPPSVPSQLENLYVESGRGGNLEQVQIEDLGPDEEEDASASPEKGADADLKETTLITAPEQNKMFSLQSLSSPSVPQQYLPGN